MSQNKIQCLKIKYSMWWNPMSSNNWWGTLYYPINDGRPRAHHTCKKQGDLTSPSETMREKWRHDRETSNSVIETCFCKNMVFFSQFFLYLHLKCVFANILLISFIFNNKFMFCIRFIIINDLIFVYFKFYSFLPWNL